MWKGQAQAENQEGQQFLCRALAAKWWLTQYIRTWNTLTLLLVSF